MGCAKTERQPGVSNMPHTRDKKGSTNLGASEPSSWRLRFSLIARNASLRASRSLAAREMRNGQGVDIASTMNRRPTAERIKRAIRGRFECARGQQLETVELTRTYSLTSSPDGESAGANQRHWRQRSFQFPKIVTFDRRRTKGRMVWTGQI